VTSVVVVDDQALVRVGLVKILDAEPDVEVAGEAADGEDAVAAAARIRPDVVLMDIRMPGMDGIEATRRIVAEHPATRVLVLTTFDVDEYAFAALRSGASGFLLKNALPEELVAAIRTVAAGSSIVAPRIVRRLLDLFAPHLPTTATATADLNPALRTLTPRELDVLRCVAEGLSNAEIAERLVLSATTVKTHVGNMLAKLGVRDRVQAVIVAYESGLVRQWR
jgi:DNA-binding NarL/FixJ family response regulator